MTRKKILTIVVLIVLLLILPIIVMSIAEKPLEYMDGRLVIREGDKIPENLPEGTLLTFAIEEKSSEQIEQEQRELKQRLKEQIKEQAIEDFENGIIREDDRLSEEEIDKFKKIYAEGRDEWDRQQQLYENVMIKFYGKERIEKLIEQMKGESFGLNAAGTIFQSDIEWYTLVADTVENKKISDEEREILKSRLQSFMSDCGKTMPTELKVRIQNVLKMRE